MYSVYDELEGRTDSMMAYQACHLCHNANKKCVRPPAGGQCKRCASTYIARPWAQVEEPPSFSDSGIFDRISALQQPVSKPELIFFENNGAYHTLTISLASTSDPHIRGPSSICFWGPFRYDNADLVLQFDQIVYTCLSTPRVEVSKDPQGLVYRACLAGGYFYLFFSVITVIDESETPLNSRALLLAFAHFILGRLATIVNDVMSLARCRPMSKNARLSLAALHVSVNRVKLLTSRLEHLRALYDDPELSTLLRDRIHCLEGELRTIFQEDCGLIRDWSAPLDYCGREFKNTARSFDPLTLTVKVSTWDDLARGDMYPVTLSTPSGSEHSPLPVGSLVEVDLPSLQFAGLENNHTFESEDWDSNRTSAGSSSPSILSSIDYNNVCMEDLPFYVEENSLQAEDLHRYNQELVGTISGDQSAYHLDMADDPLTDWDVLLAIQVVNAGLQEQDLGSPTWWDSDPGNSDGALN